MHNNEYLQEPSLFAMTSLLETGTANLERIDLIWPPITSHFIEVLYSLIQHVYVLCSVMFFCVHF